MSEPIIFNFDVWKKSSYYATVEVEHSDSIVAHTAERYIYSTLKYFDVNKANDAKKLKLPKYKVDCNVYFYDEVNHTVPVGLIPRLTRALKKQYQCKVNLSPVLYNMFVPPKDEVTRDRMLAFANTLHMYNREEGFEIKPYEHQLNLAVRAINGRRISLLACTSAGKSLSMMIIARYLVEREHKKLLIIVPSTNLVEQLYSDFYNDYGWDDAKKHCTLIHGTSSDKLSKKDKERLASLNLGEESVLKDITISTWQSLTPKLNEGKSSYNPDFFKVFDAVLVDEAHGTRGEKLRDILAACSNADDFKVGVSGTLPDDGLDAAFIESALGRKEEIVRLHTLIEKKILTPVEVHAILIPYPNKLRPAICRQSYDPEYAIVTNNSSRKDVTDMLIKAGHITTEQNTVVLFKQIANLESYLEYMQEHHPEFKYHVINGETGVTEREDIRKSIEKSVGNMIIATYGCMKQGVNIKLLHNLIMAEPAKSMYMVVQSIGRIVRPHKEKKLARVFDLVDNASYMTNSRSGPPKRQTNCMVRHYVERKSYYDNDFIPIKTIDLAGIYEAPITTDSITTKRAKAAGKEKISSKPASSRPYKKKFFVQ